MHISTLVRRAGALAALLLAMEPAHAQVSSVQLTSDNDAYNFWIPASRRPDYEYSNGIRLALEVQGARGWHGIAAMAGPCARGEAPADAAAGCATTTVEVGQRLYVPRRDSYEPEPGIRPYAGWLYVAGTGRVVNGPVRHTFAAEVGVTGEPSLGRQVMENYHDVAGFWKPIGWSHQLGFEPGVVLRYGVERRLGELRAGDTRAADLLAEAGVSAGNVHTGARVGLRARAGHRLRHPWAVRAAPGTSVYVTAGARAEAVARNLFLDGSTFGAEPARVRREPFLAQSTWGVGLARGGFGIEYRVEARTREYREEPGGHPYATIELTWRP